MKEHSVDSLNRGECAPFVGDETVRRFGAPANGKEREECNQKIHGASKCMGTEELIWTSLCPENLRGCEPRRPRGSVAVPRRASQSEIGNETVCRHVFAQ